MSAQTVYSGPAKVIASVGTGPTLYPLQANGENGEIKLAIHEERTKHATAMHGYVRSTLTDQYAKLTLTPFDSWALLPYLFPPYLGITVGAANGVLGIGTRPFDYYADTSGATHNGTAPVRVFAPDGRLYSVVRHAVTKHPSMKLGVGQALFDAIEITGLGDPGKDVGASAFLMAASPVTETGATDPDTAGFTPDFINGHWTGAWGALTGFTAMEVEDFWTLSVDAKYSMLKIQGLTRHAKLDSVEIMIKGRLAGPTHTQILAKALAHTLGATLGEASATDLVLTGPSSKTVTLKDCELILEGNGPEFGGSKLGTGEVAFVSKVDFSGTPSVPTPALIFSA